MYKKFEELYPNNCKFRHNPKGDKIVVDIYGNKTLKEGFIPTTTYLNYLADKQTYEYKQETLHLKEKLQHQMQVYGEVDPIDLANFQQRLKKEYNIKY